MNDINGRLRDTRSIDFQDENEIQYWIKYFQTNRDELYAAVSAVGASAQKVKEYLATKEQNLSLGLQPAS
jgi:hypothetical protein